MMRAVANGPMSRIGGPWENVIVCPSGTSGWIHVNRSPIGCLRQSVILGCDAGAEQPTSMDGGSVLDSTRDMVDSSVERLDGSVFLDGALNEDMDVDAWLDVRDSELFLGPDSEGPVAYDQFAQPTPLDASIDAMIDDASVPVDEGLPEGDMGAESPLPENECAEALPGPGGIETCDGFDQDCDGVVDERC